jgi:hypothetical protein
VTSVATATWSVSTFWRLSWTSRQMAIARTAVANAAVPSLSAGVVRAYAGEQPADDERERQDAAEDRNLDQEGDHRAHCSF